MARTQSKAVGRSNQRTGTNRTTRSRSAYQYDSTARRLDVQRELEEAPRRRISNETRKNRDKAHHMSLGYVVFLAAALCACAFILINYIQMQAELTGKITNVATLESELNNLRTANDEEYSRITSNVNLEEIRRIAISELGMVYATEGQIITYSGDSTDYMRRVSSSN